MATTSINSSDGLRQRLPIEIKVSQVNSNDNESDSDSDSLIDNINNNSEQEDLTLPTFDVPPFTVKDLLGCIPLHCFERSALKSSSYILLDFTLIGIYSILASFIDTSFGSNGLLLNGFKGEIIKWLTWSIYWIMAGFSFTGIWIIGHECGHQAFSPSKTINNSVGLILHSLLLVPYHAWRISHSKHHAATGHMNRDEVFVPPTKSEVVMGTGTNLHLFGVDIDELLEDAPFWRFINLVAQQTLGWPLYLFKNSTGRADYKGANHFQPSSPIFDTRHRFDILLSDFTLGLMVTALTLSCQKFGVGNVVKYYGIPYLFTNHWLVMITYLQHTASDVPHYRADVWNFARGALCTVDRNMLGFVGPYLLHGICETHVSHHISSKIPHYNAWEATEALKNLLGDHYQSSDENMFVSLWKNYKSCKYVEDEGQIVFYKDAHGKAAMRPNFDSVLVSDSGVDL